MKFLDTILDQLAMRLNQRAQGIVARQKVSDAAKKGVSYSIESTCCENVANLMLLNFDMPVTGTTARAQWLDGISTDFVRRSAQRAAVTAMLTGDCIVVPSWNGHCMQHAIVPADRFAIFGANGDEITSCAYVIDRKTDTKAGTTYTLLGVIDLIEEQGQPACRFRTFIARDGALTDMTVKDFRDWGAENEVEWRIPNVRSLLIGRYKNVTIDPMHPNAQKGVPLCFGASDPISEIHYLTEQMHAEFSLSEKAIIADKRLFRTRDVLGSHGEVIKRVTELPQGREKLFMDTDGTLGSGSVTEWAPSIQLQPYAEALEIQYRRVEQCIGVNAGILSKPENEGYMNVDNVRKSTIQTQALISAQRRAMEKLLDQLMAAWDAWANWYGVTPVGPYEVSYDWSDDYINTFADQQQSLLAGIGVGATDAVDYRMFVTGESPEAARERVAEIKAAQSPAFAIE